MTSDLIARLEAADCGSRELDAEIWWTTLSADARALIDPSGYMGKAFAREKQCEFALCWGPLEPYDRKSAEGDAADAPLAACAASLRALKARESA